MGGRRREREAAGREGERGGRRTEVIPGAELLGLCVLDPDLLGVVQHDVHELVEALRTVERGSAKVLGG